MHTNISARKEAEARLRASEIRYRRLFEAAHDGVVLIDPGTRKITDVNPFMTKLLGYTRAQLIGKELFEIGLLKDKAASRKMFRVLKRSRALRYENLPLERRDGHRQEVEVVANLYMEDSRPIIQCNIRDITERKRAERALVASEERFRVLFELGPVGVYSCDASGRILDFNRRAVELWGRKPDLARGTERFCGSYKLFFRNGTLMPPGRCPMAAVLQGRMPAARDVEVSIGRPDGSRITAVVNIVPLKNEQGEIVGAINCFYDISARKHTEEALRAARSQLARHAGELQGLVIRRTRQLTVANRALKTTVRSLQKSQLRFQELFLEAQGMHQTLRQLTHEIMTGQEDERKAISRGLHDEVMQTLVGINLEMGGLTAGSGPEDESQRALVTRIQGMVESSVKTVHQFARDLRPAVLDDFGLIPALLTCIRKITARKNIPVQLTACDDVETLDNHRRTVLFRVAQEALNNVVRHAAASKARVEIRRAGDTIVMEVSDDGRAFPVEQVRAVKNPKRLGLLGMKERMEMVGGTLHITSAPGQGTTVRAELPFKPSNPAV